MIGKNEIRVIYGDNPKQMVKELLEAIRPEDEIDKTALIGIKPNLVVAKPASSGATTSSDIVEGLIE
ncbi:MAG: iron-sulfur cluster-binding protein, partial [Bacillota bacterium]